jgi:hypothetical protein
MALHLLDPYGKEVASWSGRPVYGAFPTDKWPADARVRDPWHIALPSEVAPGEYQISLSLRDAGKVVYRELTEMARVTLGSLSVVARRVSFEAPPTQFQSNVPFGDVAILLGYNLTGELLPEGAVVRVELLWRALRSTDQPYMVAVQLTDAHGSTLAEHGGAPAGGRVSTTEWQVGEVVADLHEMRVTARQPGAVSLAVRLLDVAGASVPPGDGRDALIIPDVERKVVWVSPAQ